MIQNDELACAQDMDRSFFLFRCTQFGLAALVAA